MKAIRDQDLDGYNYCDDSWSKELYNQSCAIFPDYNPVTLMEHMTSDEMNPPAAHKGRGRPNNDVLTHKQLHKN